jgi:hypothetical protein
MVMTKYPKIEKERTCRMERELRNAARKEYYEKLYEAKRAQDILEAGNKDTTEVTS